MWFLFGLISFIGFAIYFINVRMGAEWKGITAQIGQVSYQYEILHSAKDAKKTTGLRIGIKAPQGYDFVVKPENWRDRFFKWIGLSVEYQVGETEFDAAVYIVSNDSRVGMRLKQNSQLRSDILAIFKAVTPSSAHIREVRCLAGRLWVQYSLHAKKFNTGKLPMLAERVVPRLGAFADDLKKYQGSVDGTRDPFVWKAILILSISSALFFNGVVHLYLYRLSWLDIPFTIDNEVLIRLVLYCSAVIVGALVMATLFFLGRSARAHLVLLEILITGSLGAVATGYTELRNLNMEFDFAIPVVYESVVTGMEIKHRSKGRTTYHLWLNDWTKESAVREIQVSSQFYRGVERGSKVLVRQKPGYLHARWVEHISIAK